MIGFISGILRRIFGGLASKLPILKERGVQWILYFLLYGTILYFNQYNTWAEMHLNKIVFVIFAYFFIMIEISTGHYYYFKMGTESDEYIDEQEAKGRKPAMDWLVRPVNKLLGFEPRKAQYCFVGMFIRYFVWSLPVSVFVGWSFSACAFAIPFIYAGMFWVKLPKFLICNGETNWAEFFSGLIIGWALL